MYICVTLGVSLLSAFWNLCIGLAVVPAVLQMLLLPMCPESPRYLLITRQREDEARRGEKDEKLYLLWWNLVNAFTIRRSTPYVPYPL